jgi:hypothetical protein
MRVRREYTSCKFIGCIQYSRFSVKQEIIAIYIFRKCKALILTQASQIRYCRYSGNEKEKVVPFPISLSTVKRLAC